MSDLKPTLKKRLDILSKNSNRKKIDIIENGIVLQDPQVDLFLEKGINGKQLFIKNINKSIQANLEENVKIINKPINSPFRYVGGKFYARKLIAEHLIEHDHYIEPFAGGASIFFYKEKCSFNHLNDLDEDLIRVYKFIRDYPNDLIEWLAGRKVTKEVHGWYKNEFNPKTELGKAGRWYFLNRISYSGIMKSQNMYWGYGEKFSMRPENWPRNIERTSEKLQNVELTSIDFEKVIDQAPDGSLLFIDPPYFSADQDKFYAHSFSKDDHFRLLNCLKRNNERLKWFLTYDNVDEVRELYFWAKEIYDKEWNYCIQRSDDQKEKTNKKGKRYKGKELFILNYRSNGN